MTELEFMRIGHRVQQRLLTIQQMFEIEELKEKGGDTLVDPKVAALITQFDEVTNLIAAKIQKLISAGGLSTESEAALKAVVENLRVLGADPENPIPSAARS